MIVLGLPKGPIEMLLTDVDGVWNDGTVLTCADGPSYQRWDKRDASAAQRAMECGLRVEAVTAEQDGVAYRRFCKIRIGCTVLKPECCRPLDRLALLRVLAVGLDMDPGRIAYMGDDYSDLPCLAWAGLALWPQNSPVSRIAKHTQEACYKFAISRRGGDRAVETAIQKILSWNGEKAWLPTSVSRP